MTLEDRLDIFLVNVRKRAKGAVLRPIRASRLAEVTLLAGGASVIREGNILDVGGHGVAVAEACSGIRYLLSLGFVEVVLPCLTFG